jgi:endonuclease-3
MISDENIEKLFERFAEANSSPTIELEYVSPYTLLVAVVLSAQATDKMVNKITPELFKVAKTPQQMINLGEESLKQYIKSINYFNNKAKNIIATSKVLLEKYGGEVPTSFAELIELPGIGRKSANVILNTAFNHPTIAVDTHVFRVSNRIGLCNTKTPHKTEFALMKIVPERFKNEAHHWLVLHGRYVCKARKPLCDACKVSDLCTYYKSKTKK